MSNNRCSLFAGTSDAADFYQKCLFHNTRLLVCDAAHTLVTRVWSGAGLINAHAVLLFLRNCQHPFNAFLLFWNHSYNNLSKSNCLKVFSPLERHQPTLYLLHHKGRVSIAFGKKHLFHFQIVFQIFITMAS